MNRDPNRILADWLDDDTPSVHIEHEDSADMCDMFADALVVHGLLSDESRRDTGRDADRIRTLMQSIDEDTTAPAVTLTKKRRPAWMVAAGIVTTIAGLVMAIGVLRPSPVTAAEALENIIQAVTHPVDRCYRLTVIEEYSDVQSPKGAARKRKRPVKFQDELNGAVLYVGGLNRFVFVRELTDGRKRVSGCDGSQSWAFREDSAIHVSSQLRRYRGGLPGHQHNLGFTDLHSQLSTLREGYMIDLSPLEDGPPGQDLYCLTAEHRAKGVGGPKSMQIDFDMRTGTIHRMLLDGLPRDRGGPKSVEFVLVSQEPVGDAFYAHESHHESGRRVKND